MSAPREHRDTEEMVCPYCHEVQGDSWEVGPSDHNGTTECGDCGEEFKWTRDFEVTYITNPRSTP